MDEDASNSHLGQWIIISFIAVAILFTIVVAWWWWAFQIPTSPPLNVRSYYVKSENSDRFIFKFTWENGDQWPVNFYYKLTDFSKSKVISEGSTSSTEWLSPGLSNDTYIFSIYSKASTWFTDKDSSGIISIQVNVNNPSSSQKNEEVFALIGNDSSNSHQYFTTRGKAKRVCEAIGAELASDTQLTEAFNDGADWWMYTWYDSINNEIVGGYPCWYNAQACQNKAQIVPIDQSQSLAGVSCWGLKPEQNQKMNIPSHLIDNRQVTSITSVPFSFCQQRYYQHNTPSDNLCSCDLNSCSS